MDDSSNGRAVALYPADPGSNFKMFYIKAVLFLGCRETLFGAYIAAAARRRSR